jgi:hypothetical protein
MNKTFNEYSINIENDTARVTGDAKQSSQVEMLWLAIGKLGEQSEISPIQSEFQDWIRTSDEDVLQLFSIQQKNLNRILINISQEQLAGELSNNSIGELTTYSAYQLSLLVLFGVDGTYIGEGIQYLLDEQRNNPKLTLIPHCSDCGNYVNQDNEVLH